MNTVNVIYVVSARHGSYSETWDENLFAVTSEEKAALEVERLTELHAFIKSIWMEVYSVWCNHWEKHHEAVRAEMKAAAKSNSSRALQVRLSDEVILKVAETTKQKAIELGCSEEHLWIMGLMPVEGRLIVPSFDADTVYSYDALELR